jgi:hypothetical protein
MAASTGPVQVRIEGLPAVRHALESLPAAVRKSYDRRVVPVAAVIAADARRRASWSRRIPRAIVSSVIAKGAQITVRAATAPHGPLYEGSGRGGSFRHPLFGNRRSWYQQRTRPFVQPAVDAREHSLESAGNAAVDDGKRQVDLR